MPHQQHRGGKRKERSGGRGGGRGERRPGTDTLQSGDIELECRDCQAKFAFTTRAQALHAEQGFTQPPTRCPVCRKAKRARNEAAASGVDVVVEGNSSGKGLGGGMTYEERRVLGKNRKERRADAAAAEEQAGGTSGGDKAAGGKDKREAVSPACHRVPESHRTDPDEDNTALKFQPCPTSASAS
jgi:hypothetical protein